MNQSEIELRLLATELLKRTTPMPVQSCRILAAEITRLAKLASQNATQECPECQGEFLHKEGCSQELSFFAGQKPIGDKFNEWFDGWCDEAENKEIWGDPEDLRGPMEEAYSVGAYDATYPPEHEEPQAHIGE